MDLTLKQARRLETAIAVKIQARLAELRSSVQVTRYNANHIRTKVKEAADKALDAFDVIKQLNIIRYQIRRQIELRNETAGINALMNREELLKAQRQMLQTFIRLPSLSEEDITVIFNRLTAGEVSRTTGYAGEWNDVQNIPCTFTQEDIDAKNTELRVINRELEAIADNTAALNSTMKLTIELSSVETLTKEGLL